MQKDTGCTITSATRSQECCRISVFQDTKKLSITRCLATWTICPPDSASISGPLLESRSHGYIQSTGVKVSLRSSSKCSNFQSIDGAKHQTPRALRQDLFSFFSQLVQAGSDPGSTTLVYPRLRLNGRSASLAFLLTRTIWNSTVFVIPNLPMRMKPFNKLNMVFAIRCPFNGHSRGCAHQSWR